MAKTPAFSGFSTKTTAFLRDLGSNNSKAWFDDHRKDYDANYVAPAKGFVVAIGAELKTRISPAIQAQPKVNGSLFRINRDTRFSKDKTPYKDHMDMMFWEGPGRSRDCPGLFFRLTADRVHLGAGKHGFDKEQMVRFRDAVADETSGPALVDAIARSTELAGAVVGGDQYKKVPKGFAPDHPRADLLRYKGLSVFVELDHPACIDSTEFVTWCAERLTALAPVHTWLVGAITEPAT